MNPREPLSKEIERVASDLVDRALEHIRDFESDPDTSVHELRKRLKEQRAVVRMARGELGERGYRMENVRLRDAGRLLSPARDSAVLIETLKTLRDRPDARGVNRELDALRDRLAEEYDAEMRRLVSGNVLADVEMTLSDLGRRIPLWPARREDFSAVRDGLQRVYGNSRQALQDAREDPTDARLHEWRKQTKYLWYSVRMLARAWPPVLNGLAESLHDLSDALGVDHDLAVLSDACRGRLAEACGSILPATSTIIRHRREETRREMWLLGARIFAEEPEEFAGRMKTYWRAGSNEG